MNSRLMWGLVVIALLVGAYIGYAYEKAKFVRLMEAQRYDMQRQIDEAKKVSADFMMPKDDLVLMANDEKLGAYGTDPKGMTLYTYDKDTTGKSNCTGQCAVNWPPYLVTGTVSTALPDRMGTIERADGTMQYTWDGMPLYYYINDKTGGDVTGEGVGGVWHVAK